MSSKVLNRALKVGKESIVIAGTAIDVESYDGSGMITKAYGASVPASLAGFAKGGLFVKTGVAAGTKALYENVGDTSSCNFNLIGDVTAGEITLARGNVLVGNSSGVAQALDANDSGKILVGNGTDLASVAVSGDITLAANGTVAIASDVIVNADVKSDAAIDFSKLATMTAGNLLVGSAGNVPTSVAMSGDATLSSAGALTLSAGVVTSAKMATAAKVHTVSQSLLVKLPAPTGANQSDLDRYAWTVPEACTVRAVRLISDTATAASGATNQYTFNVRNATAGNNLGTADTGTNGAELAAGVPKSVTVDQNLTLAAGDVITFRTNILDDGGAGPTNLSAALLAVQIDYVTA